MGPFTVGIIFMIVSVTLLGIAGATATIVLWRRRCKKKSDLSYTGGIVAVPMTVLNSQSAYPQQYALEQQSRIAEEDSSPAYDPEWQRQSQGNNTFFPFANYADPPGGVQEDEFSNVSLSYDENEELPPSYNEAIILNADVQNSPS